jgi:hypothetical protein
MTTLHLPAPQKRLGWFFAILGALAILELLLTMVVVPTGLVPLASIVISVIFVATPIFAIFVGSGYRWTPWLAIGFLAGGALVHVACVTIHATGATALVLSLLRQIGLITWCLGLGAFLSTLIKDKNLIVPIAIFLAMLDMFLVLTPIGLTQKLMTEHGKEAKKALYEVPAPKTAPTPKGQPTAPPEALAFVGPADFLFLGMFFVALYRFSMKTRQTLLWIVPVLAAYLLIVLLAKNASFFGVPLGMLPALLPIGVTIFLVNRDEFNLNKDEKLSTAVLTAIMLVVLIYGMSRPRQAPVPSKPASQTK